MKEADLHLHSRFSDGTEAPAALVARAREAGLAAVSLTDHDTMEGEAEAAAACEALGVEFIPGVELTAELGRQEAHILGYGADASCPELAEAMARFQRARQERIREMVRRLRPFRIELEAEQVFALAGCRAPGRPHLARALVSAGYCADAAEAFERFLGRDKPAWAPKYRLPVEEAIDLIHRAGGLAVLAHPGLSGVDRAIPRLIRQGIDGIECFHSKHSPAQAERYAAAAREAGLLITGGSDCHGGAMGKPTMGQVRLPFEHFEALRRRLAERAALRA